MLGPWVRVPAGSQTSKPLARGVFSFIASLGEKFIQTTKFVWKSQRDHRLTNPSHEGFFRLQKYNCYGVMDQEADCRAISTAIFPRISVLTICSARLIMFEKANDPEMPCPTITGLRTPSTGVPP